MTDFHQRQAVSTLTAPAARGLAPHSLVQPDIRHALYPATGTNYLIIIKKTKGYGMFDLKGQNITITILGKYSIDHSSSPDSRLKQR